MRPNRSSAALMIRSVVARSVRSPLTVSRAGSWAGSIVRDTATTAQPFRRYAATRPAPMPWEPPVMIATLRSCSPMAVLASRVSHVQELAPAARQSGLADLDQMTVGVTQVAADLALVLFRWREGVRAPVAPLRMHGLDVGDADVEKA